jgi:hypothetical protein
MDRVYDTGARWYPVAMQVHADTTHARGPVVVTLPRIPA